MLDEYIYKSLNEYRNTIISNKNYKRYGESTILEDLREHGYECVLRQAVEKVGKRKEIYYVIWCK